MVDQDQREWDIILEECKSLRTEILGKTENPYKIVGLVVTAIGTLLGVAIQNEVFTLALVLPMVIIISIFLFKSEERAIDNAAEYICMIENKFIKNYPEVGWERWLKKNPDRKRIYDVFGNVSRIILFILYLGCIYIIISFPEMETHSTYMNPNFKYLAGFIYILIGISVVYYIYVDSNRSEKKM